MKARSGTPFCVRENTAYRDEVVFETVPEGGDHWTFISVPKRHIPEIIETLERLRPKTKTQYRHVEYFAPSVHEWNDYPIQSGYATAYVTLGVETREVLA